MKTGFIGLGKMGMNMVAGLLDHGHEVLVYDLSQSNMEEAAGIGARAVDSLSAMVSQLEPRRILWMMVPAGKPVDTTMDALLPHLSAGDILVDGGNSNYRDSVRRARDAARYGVLFLDIGTSGGLEGARHGACMMAGGSREAYAQLEPLIRDMCVDGGYGYMGASGAGHFAKMVHNGVEYGMMQAIGEGFDILDSSQFEFDHREVARVWSNGSVIRGWLMELVCRAFEKDGRLDYLSGEIADSGEGKWTLEAALEEEVSVPVIAAALFRRYRSRSDDNFSDKVVAALRHEFGGHGFSSKEV